MTEHGGVQMKISAGTDKGMVRPSNQDCYAIGEFPAGVWAVVCDGMGGHSGGNVASKMATDIISARIKENLRPAMRELSVRNMLESAVVTANADIFVRASKEKELEGMGTTAVVVVCMDSKAVIAHVGDSRCYLIRKDTITQLTKDHSLVQELVDAGVLAKEDAENHHLKNIITRAIGIEDDLDVDFYDTELYENDKLLLCSDGLTNHVSNDEILSLINNNETFDYATKLISKANENGGKDNITAVILEN